jgi:hypothetical protein
LVAEQCPEWQQHRQWLRDHEGEIHAAFPS